MPFITIAGTDYEVTEDGASHGDPLRQGAVVRAFAGNARSTIRSVKRQWDLTIFFDDPTDETALRTATELGQAVTCTGDALLGASVSCIVTVGASEYIPNLAATYGHWRTASVHLEEV
jgi:hypothetical protein